MIVQSFDSAFGLSPCEARLHLSTQGLGQPEFQATRRNLRTSREEESPPSRRSASVERFVELAFAQKVGLQIRVKPDNLLLG